MYRSNLNTVKIQFEHRSDRKVDTLMPMPASAKHDGYHHGALREALIRASLELIEEGGVQALSLRAAARRAGVSPGAPYHHFPNRAALMAAIAMDGFEMLRQETVAATADDPDPMHRLRAAGKAYVRFATSHPAHFRVMFRPELADPHEFTDLEQKSHPTFENLVQAVVDCQKAGAIPEGDTQGYVLLCWSVVHGLSSLVIDGPLAKKFPHLDATADELGDMVVRTLTRVLAR